MTVREHQGRPRQFEPRRSRGPLPGDRVGAEQQRLLDQLHTPHPLQHRVDLAGLHRSAERPSFTVRPAPEWVEVAVEGGHGRVAEAVGVHALTRHQAGHHRHALVHRGLDDHPRADDPSLVEVGRHPRQRAIVGHEILEPQLAELVLRDGGHDEDPHGRVGGALARQQAPDPGHLRRRLARQLLEVLGRDRPAPRPEQDRRADLGTLDALTVDTTDGRMTVVDARDVGDRRLEHADRASGHVAAASAAAAV